MRKIFILVSSLLCAVILSAQKTPNVIIANQEAEAILFLLQDNYGFSSQFDAQFVYRRLLKKYTKNALKAIKPAQSAAIDQLFTSYGY